MNLFKRWQRLSQSLERDLSSIEECCLISAALVTFLGSSNEEGREKLLKVGFLAKL